MRRPAALLAVLLAAALGVTLWLVRELRQAAATADGVAPAAVAPPRRAD
jgi:hypothetical protein